MKTGRPQKEIDKKTFEKLCYLQCTEIEISAFLDCGRTTLYRWCKKTYGKTFETVYKEKSKAGLISLRRNMFKQSEKNPATAIFLAKNYLGMKDKFDVDEKVDNNIHVKIDYGDESDDQSEPDI